MRIIAASVVGRMFAGKVTLSGFPGVIMSLGAGFYEELTYRLLLFSVGGVPPPNAPLLAKGTLRGALMTWGWAFVCAGIFSAAHYVGPMRDDYDAKSFAFRMVLGMLLTIIFVFRGFAAAVWTHAVYDMWVMVF